MSKAAIDYGLMELEKQADIQSEMTRALQEKKENGKGRPNSLRHAILDYVVGGDYERAKAELNDYLEYKKDYPAFVERSTRYIKHCHDLISAIETKRNFPGLAGLALSKQQELYDRVVGHFEELKGVLKNIEVLEKETQLNDIRSTVWFVRAVVNSVFFLLIVGIFIELYSGLGESFGIVFDSLVDDLANYVTKLI